MLVLGVSESIEGGPGSEVALAWVRTHNMVGIELLDPKPWGHLFLPDLKNPT